MSSEREISGRAWREGTHGGTLVGPRGLELIPGVSRGVYERALDLGAAVDRAVISLCPEPFPVGAGLRLSVRARRGDGGWTAWAPVCVIGCGKDLPRSESGEVEGLKVAVDVVELAEPVTELGVRLEVEAGELGGTPRLRRLVVVGWSRAEAAAEARAGREAGARGAAKALDFSAEIAESAEIATRERRRGCEAKGSDSDSEIPPRSHGPISAISAISALKSNAVAGPHEIGLGTRSRRSPDSASPPPAWGLELPLRELSQRALPGDLPQRACSPTSLAMLLAHHGHALSPEVVAARVHDRGGQIYGNWTFNTAFAAELGLDARVQRLAGLADLEAEVAAGRPVVISHRYEAGELRGAPASLPRTDGHLVVVAGFTPGGDVVVYDPAADPRVGESVRRVYARAELARSWNRIAYCARAERGAAAEEEQRG
ncbi:MAG: peptidase C39 family protein [Planctomycetota bacterium]